MKAIAEKAFNPRGYASSIFIKEIKAWAEQHGMELQHEKAIGGASQYLTLIDAEIRSQVTKIRISNHAEGLGYSTKSGEASVDLRIGKTAMEKYAEIVEHLDYVAAEGLYDPVPSFSSFGA